MLIKHHIIRAVALGLFLTQAQAAREIVTLNEDATISLKISNRSFNRIAVQGDRLAEIILSDDEVVVERDEVHGAAYIRVSPGYKQKIDVTLITESGVVQDLELEPTNQAPHAIVLKAKDSVSPPTYPLATPTSQMNLSQASLGQTSLFQTSLFQERIIEMMQWLARGYGSTDADALEYRSGIEGLELTPQRHVTQNDITGAVYEITNNSEEDRALSERDFYKLGDLSLGLSQHTLKTSETALLYVIRKSAP